MWGEFTVFRTIVSRIFESSVWGSTFFQSAFVPKWQSGFHLIVLLCVFALVWNRDLWRYCFFRITSDDLVEGKKRKKQMTTLLQRQSVSRHCRNKRRMTLKGDQRDVLMGSSLRRGLPEGRALLEGAAWGLSAAKGRSDVCVGDARVFWGAFSGVLGAERGKWGEGGEIEGYFGCRWEKKKGERERRVLKGRRRKVRRMLWI